MSRFGRERTCLWQEKISCKHLQSFCVDPVLNSCNLGVLGLHGLVTSLRVCFFHRFNRIVGGHRMTNEIPMRGGNFTVLRFYLDGNNPSGLFC